LDFREFQSQVEARIRPVLQAGADALGVPVSEVDQGGGKHIRPRLIHECALALGADMDRCADLGAAAEMLHLASLCHDDVIDGATTRRGRPSLNSRIGNQKSILLGDFIHASAAHLASRSLGLAISSFLAETVVRMCSSELMESRLRWNPHAGLNLYIEVIDGKTAALFEACSGATAMVAGVDADTVRAFRKFGNGFGMAFQILDDMLDYFPGSESWGKEPLKDLTEGMATLPLINALERTGGKGLEPVIEWLGSRGKTALDPALTAMAIKASGAMDHCNIAARDFMVAGLEAINMKAPAGGLRAFAEESLKRRF
jgi:geranylgeranyl pyrophosphate synthase